MKICLQLDGKNLPATLNDSPAARDFAALLPLTLTLKDYAATEKISDLPRRLSRRRLRRLEWTRQSETSPFTLRGGTWRSSTGMPPTQRGLSSLANSMAEREN
jgi:hypothetical protein